MFSIIIGYILFSTFSQRLRLHLGQASQSVRMANAFWPEALFVSSSRVRKSVRTSELEASAQQKRKETNRHEQNRTELRAQTHLPSRHIVKVFASANVKANVKSNLWATAAFHRPPIARRWSLVVGR